MYKQLRNKIQKMLKEAEMMYRENELNKASNSKEFWQVKKGEWKGQEKIYTPN